MSAFIDRITGSQVGGATERSIRLSLSFIRLGPVIILLLLVLAMTPREEQLGSLLGVEE
jgi:hypothetical protein